MEKQKRMVENLEIPPTPETPLEFEFEASHGQAKEVDKANNVEVRFEPPVAKDNAGLSKKGEEATKDGSQVKSQGIFASCGSFKKI